MSLDEVTSPGGAGAGGVAADAETVQDLVGAMVVAGANVSATYDDNAGTLTLAVTGLTEAAQDAVAAAVVAGTGISAAYNDAANTLTIAVSGLTSAQISDFTEATQDVVGALAFGGSGLTATYNDAGNAETIDVNVDGATLEVNADTVRVKDGGITVAKLATALFDAFALANGGGKEKLKVHGTVGATETIDLADGNGHTMTLGAAACTLTFTGAVTGYVCSFTLVVTQDATGSRTITWPASVHWGSSSGVPTLSTGAFNVDILTFFTTNGGTTWWGNLVDTHYI